ncbi:tRNA 2-selenouridine(34) synthase MnmH, partial [Pseudomonas sp. CCC2.2]|nr:tRNA 2-selenouridine(34) synthase MnmH [Pseudomonas sp. CCC2.2]
IMDSALIDQEKTGAVKLHRDCIIGMQSEYYDPIYAYQRDSKGPRIEFSGDQADVLENLTDRVRRLD